MKRLTLILPTLGLLLLCSCTSKALEVKNSKGRTVGSIEVQAAKTATFVSMHGESIAKVRGTIVRDASGKQMGTTTERDGTVVILNPKGNPVGSLSKGTDCYGKGQEMLGTVSAEADTSVAAGACLVFFLQ